MGHFLKLILFFQSNLSTLDVLRIEPHNCSQCILILWLRSRVCWVFLKSLLHWLFFDVILKHWVYLRWSFCFLLSIRIVQPHDLGHGFFMLTQIDSGLLHHFISFNFDVKFVSHYFNYFGSFFWNWFYFWNCFI